MELSQALRHTFADIRDRAHRAVKGLDADALAWRADPDANSVAWLVWHFARVEDSHVAEIADREQVWATGQWAQQFGLPTGYDDTGYGHSARQVGEIRPEADVLLGYLDAVTAMVDETLEQMSPDDFDRIVDRSYDPPVTAGIRFMSVIGDGLQHVGQAAFVRGLYERSG